MPVLEHLVPHGKVSGSAVNQRPFKDPTENNIEGLPDHGVFAEGRRVSQKPLRSAWWLQSFAIRGGRVSRMTLRTIL